MLKQLALSAALVSLLCPTLRAGDLEDAFSAASAAVRRAYADPCSQNKELERNVFRFKLEGEKDSASMDVRFAFVSCHAEDEWYDDYHAANPRAIRRYKGDSGDYELQIETEFDAADSYVTLLQKAANSIGNSAWLGSHPNASLLTQRIDFAFVSVLDAQAQETLRGPAFLLSYDPSPAPGDEPFDCR